MTRPDRILSVSRFALEATLYMRQMIMGLLIDPAAPLIRSVNRVRMRNISESHTASRVIRVNRCFNDAPPLDQCGISPTIRMIWSRSGMLRGFIRTGIGNEAHYIVHVVLFLGTVKSIVLLMAGPLRLQIYCGALSRWLPLSAKTLCRNGWKNMRAHVSHVMIMLIVVKPPVIYTKARLRV